MSIQAGTFNTIGSNTTTIGGDFPVWSRVRELYQGGGVIDTTDYDAGDVIPAGTMVVFAGPGQEVTIVDNDAEDATLATVNGLIYNDVCIPEGVTLATCAVVRNGRIYADRVGLPSGVETYLPMIEFVRES